MSAFPEKELPISACRTLNMDHCRIHSQMKALRLALRDENRSFLVRDFARNFASLALVVFTQERAAMESADVSLVTSHGLRLRALVSRLLEISRRIDLAPVQSAIELVELYDTAIRLHLEEENRFVSAFVWCLYAQRFQA